MKVTSIHHYRVSPRYPVTIDGEPLPGESIAEDGTTYVPLVPFLQFLGDWETIWDPDTRTAFAQTDLFGLRVPAQEDHVLADGFAFDLDTARGPQITC